MIIRNWKYYDANAEIGNLSITKHQYMTGNILGLIAEKKMLGSGRGSLYDARTYTFPVRMKLVDRYDGKNYSKVEEQVYKAIDKLELEGCRCIISSGGNLGLFDDVFHKSALIALSSPLVIMDFVLASIPKSKKVCIVTDLDAPDVRRIMQSLNLDVYASRCIIASPYLKEYHSVQDGTSVLDGNIGAYIWDYPNDIGQTSISHDIPIYDTKKLSLLMGMTSAQKPYAGFV